MRTEQANRHSTRYIIEHWLLPKLVSDSGRDFITKLLKDKESFMFFISINYFNKEGVSFPYTQDQYKYESAQLADDAYLVTLTMPEPEEDMECYRIHILFRYGGQRQMQTETLLRLINADPDDVMAQEKLNDERGLHPMIPPLEGEG